MKLEVTSERVLEAADSCSDAKRILQKLFPEAFRSRLNLRALVFRGDYCFFDLDLARKAGFVDNAFMQVRATGEYENKAFFLNSTEYNWELKKDSKGESILIPTLLK